MVLAMILGLACVLLAAPVLSLATVVFTVDRTMLPTRSGTATNGQIGHESGAYTQSARFVGHDARLARRLALSIQRQSKQEDI